MRLLRPLTILGFATSAFFVSQPCLAQVTTQSNILLIGGTGTTNFGSNPFVSFGGFNVIDAGSFQASININSSGGFVGGITAIPLTLDLGNLGGLQSRPSFPGASNLQVISSANRPLIVVAGAPRIPILNLGVPTDRINWQFANLTEEAKLLPFGRGKKHQVKTTFNPNSKYSPVGGFTPRMNFMSPIVSTEETSFSLRHDGSAKFQVLDSGEMKFETGAAILMAKQPVKVKCADLDLLLAPKSATYISVSPEVVLVRTLHDEHLNDVRISTGTEAISVPVGREVCIGNNESVVREALNQNYLERKNPQGVALTNGKFAMTSKFVLHSFLGHPLVVQMWRNGPDRGKVEKLLKTAACMHVTGINSSN